MQPTEIATLLQSVNSTNRYEMQQQLQDLINDLILHNFDKLVQLLYTVDVDEKRLKSLLQQRPDEDAANIIAELLISRQLQKIELRRQQSNKSTTDDSEEKW